jgi:hypothetical protein
LIVHVRVAFLTLAIAAGCSVLGARSPGASSATCDRNLGLAIVDLALATAAATFTGWTIASYQGKKLSHVDGKQVRERSTDRTYHPLHLTRV